MNSTASSWTSWRDFGQAHPMTSWRATLGLSLLCVAVSLPILLLYLLLRWTQRVGQCSNMRSMMAAFSTAPARK
jgi:hypothetical protein